MPAVSLLLRLAYDGTDFHGYAAQADRPDGRRIRTVQGELEVALAELYKVDVATRAASRTDAGVHAMGQLVAFEPPAAIPPEGLARGLNSKLSEDVRVLAAWEEEGEPVDVRRGNVGKHYRYRLCCDRVVEPSIRRYVWGVGRALDVVAMRDAAARFCGTHDFAGFRAAACQSATTVRTVHRVEVEAGGTPVGPAEDPGRLDPLPSAGPTSLDVHVHGEAFLMNMVRIMVGTLVEVGRGRWSPDVVDDLLARPDRRRSGMTAPARGLTLMEVRWPGAGER